MAKAEWGTKRVCLNCGVRFYDMLRDPIICPSCETPFDPTANLKTRRTRSATKAPAEPKASPVEVVEEDETEVDEEESIEAGIEDDADTVGDDTETDDDDEESESAIEDVSELGDDDVSDVIDVEGEDEST